MQQSLDMERLGTRQSSSRPRDADNTDDYKPLNLASWPDAQAGLNFRGVSKQKNSLNKKLNLSNKFKIQFIKQIRD
jgi:hypothetical protein